MMSRLASIVVLLAVAAVVLTAGAVGMARGQAQAAGEIVICAGQGPVTLAVDAEGRPVGPPHWCPDCVATAFAATLAAPAVLPPPPPRTVVEPTLAAGMPHGLPAPAPQARGPPARA